jgi:hypothetical protein
LNIGLDSCIAILEVEMPTIAELRTNGLSCFTHVFSGQNLALNNRYAALKSISDALATKDFVSGHLHFLEDEMWEELRRRTKESGPDRVANFNAMYPVAEGVKRAKPIKKYRNLFSTVMRRMEAENGFGELSYAWGVSAEAFLNNLTARRPFKDYSASPNYHGEHTHRVQWWLICKFVLPASGSNAQYYEECAYWTCTLTDHPDGPKTIYLWDYLFDSASNTTTFTAAESLGRNPNNVYTLCRSPEYPLLSRFMRYRMLKSVNQHVAIGDLQGDNAKSLVEKLKAMSLPQAILERAAQRFHNKSFGKLSDKQQTELVDTILDLGFTDHDLPG